MDQSTIRGSANLVEVIETPSDIPRVLRVESTHLLPTTYIIESPSALVILLKPWMVGSRLARTARNSSVDFLRAAYHIVPELRDSSFESVTEVVPLAGALYYSIAEAFESVFGETINRCFIGAKRHQTPSGWDTELAYLNFEALSTQPVIIIGDTIATGGTIERIVEATLAESSEIRAIIIYSIAGGLVGATRITDLANRIKIPIYLFYSNAIFGVEPNGTDMPWLHSGTIVSPEIRAEAEKAYGPDLGARWCCIWDWGDRAKHPVKHLEEILERCEDDLSTGVSEETRKILIETKEQTLKALEQWRSRLEL
ncbi:MAG: hypothetical protein RTU30_00195 [Candidatus Thorarchaeota archaeon]